MSEQRLVDLEIKVSYQENHIEELRQANQALYLMIEKLENNLKILTNKFKTLSEGVENSSHEKPPHY